MNRLSRAIIAWQERGRRRTQIARRRKLQRIIRAIQETPNQGYIHSRMMELPGVERVSIERGGFRAAACDVRMRDGFSISAYDNRPVQAMRNATALIAVRARDASYG